VPDGGCEREESLQDAGAYAGGFAAAVSFEIELGFQGLVDRLDDLTEWFEESCVGPFRLVGSGGGADRVIPRWLSSASNVAER